MDALLLIKKKKQDIGEALTLLESFSSATSGFQIAAGNGKIFIHGGLSTTGSILGDLDQYDIETKQWKRLAAASSTYRFYAGSFYRDGKVYIAGGRGQQAASSARNWLEVFDPSVPNSSWEKLPAGTNFTGGRGYFPGEYYPGNDCYYAYGGHNTGGTPMNVFDKISLTNNNRVSLSGLPVVVQSGAALYVPEKGVIFVCGITKVDCFTHDPVTDVVTKVANLPESVNSQCLFYKNGKMYLIGNSGTNIGKIYVYDFSTDTWRVVQTEFRVTLNKSIQVNDRCFSYGGSFRNGTSGPLTASTAFYEIRPDVLVDMYS